MNPDHQLLTGTSPECGIDFRLWVYTDGTHQVAVRPIGSLDSWPAAVTLHPYANVVADGPREMFPPRGADTAEHSPWVGVGVMSGRNLLGLIGSLRLFTVTKWDEDSNVTYSREEREPAVDIGKANVSTSIREDVGDPNGLTPTHALLIDLDVPAWLVPSSTEGHSHLYVDVAIPQDRYFHLLDSLAECGVIQYGYANSSKHRGGTALRLPWVKKPETANAAPPPPPIVAQPRAVDPF